MASRSPEAYDAFPSLSGGIGPNDGFGLRHFESSLDRIVTRTSLDRDGDNHSGYNSRFQFFNSKRSSVITETSTSDITTREDSLVKAWRTVSEIDALLGSDFRPASLPPADDDRPSVSDSYVKRLSTELEAALNVSLSFKERLRNSMKARGSFGSGASGGSGGTAGGSGASGGGSGVRQLLRQPSGQPVAVAAAAAAAAAAAGVSSGIPGWAAAAAILAGTPGGGGGGSSGLGHGAAAAAGTATAAAVSGHAAAAAVGMAGVTRRRLSVAGPIGGAYSALEASGSPGGPEPASPQGCTGVRSSPPRSDAAGIRPTRPSPRQSDATGSAQPRSSPRQSDAAGATLPRSSPRCSDATGATQSRPSPRSSDASGSTQPSAQPPAHSQSDLHHSHHHFDHVQQQPRSQVTAAYAHSHSSPLPPGRPVNGTGAGTGASPAFGTPGGSPGGVGPPSPVPGGTQTGQGGNFSRTSALGAAPGAGPGGGARPAATSPMSAVAAVTAALGGSPAAAQPPPSPTSGRGLGGAPTHIPTPPAAGAPPSPRMVQRVAAAAAAATIATTVTHPPSPRAMGAVHAASSTPAAAATPAVAKPAEQPPPARRGGLAQMRVAVGSALDHGVWDSEGAWRPSEREAEVHVPPHLQRISPDDIVKVRELGRGCFGSVWLAKWRGVEVALKELLDQGVTDGPPGEVFSEAERLASLRHPCVIAFYGIVAAPGSYATVVEYLRMGSLKSGLSRLKKQGADISRRLRVAIALQAARGMEYLHGQFVVHFDLKCDNLLCDLRDPARPVVKIGDLGLSKKKKNSFVSGNMRGTLPWMAPELFPNVRERQRQQQQQPAGAAPAAGAGAAGAPVAAAAANGGAAAGGGESELADDRVNEKVDVFSYGICLWEIWQLGEQPYSAISLGDIFAGVMTGSLRPGVPPDCDPDWAELMQACWHGTPRCRPSFSEIAERLDALLGRLTALEGSAGSATGSGSGASAGATGGGGGGATVATSRRV